jgi:hypothetical protein
MFEDAGGHVGGGQDRIDATGRERSPRHFPMSCLSQILHQRETAGTLDVLHTRGAIRVGARIHDGRGPISNVLCQRREQHIHGGANPDLRRQVRRRLGVVEAALRWRFAAVI